MEISKAEPACIQSLNRFLREVANAIMGWTFDGKEFPFDGFDLEFMLLESRPDSVSIWIYANVGEAVRATFDLEIKELRKTFLRVEVLKRRLAKIRPELREGDRAKRLLDRYYGRIETRFAFVHGFLCDLSKAFGWRESIEKQQPDTPAVAQSDPIEKIHVYEMQLPPPSKGEVRTVQLFYRNGGEPASDLVVGVVDPNCSIVTRFDLTHIKLGDYLCQLSGVSNPNAKPYPVRILDDGIYMADDWRAMDKLYPNSDSVDDRQKEIQAEALAAGVAAGMAQAAIVLEKQRGAKKLARRRGRLPKSESKILEANMLAHVREHQTLMDDPERLATLTGASASTARRFIESLRKKYAEMNRRE